MHLHRDRCTPRRDGICCRGICVCPHVVRSCNTRLTVKERISRIDIPSCSHDSSGSRPYLKIILTDSNSSVLPIYEIKILIKITLRDGYIMEQYTINKHKLVDEICDFLLFIPTFTDSYCKYFYY